MRKKILLLAVLVVASATTIDAQRKFPFFWKKKKTKTEQTTPAKKESEYDKLFKKKHETAKGLITLHLLDGKVYFELPVDLINKDMLIGSTVTSISDNGNAVVGSKPTDLLHVMFTRNKTHVQLRQVNTDYITGNTQIDEALRKSTLGAILSNQKIQAYNNDSTAIIFDMILFMECIIVQRIINLTARTFHKSRLSKIMFLLKAVCHIHSLSAIHKGHHS